MNKLKAAYQGISDTITGEELSMGMTYDDQQLSELYDRGANVGERFYSFSVSAHLLASECKALLKELCS